MPSGAKKIHHPAINVPINTPRSKTLARTVFRRCKSSSGLNGVRGRSWLIFSFKNQKWLRSRSQNRGQNYGPILRPTHRPTRWPVRGPTRWQIRRLCKGWNQGACPAKFYLKSRSPLAGASDLADSCRNYMRAIIASPNSEQESSSAPSIRRAKSYVTCRSPIAASMDLMTRLAASTQPR